jgi:hypothetical protein
MSIILFLVSICELIGGVGVFAVAKSAIHEILGALLVGFSFITFGLAAILDELRRNRIDSNIRIER